METVYTPTNTVCDVYKILKCNNFNIDLVNINVYAKLGRLPSICPQDIGNKTDNNKGHNCIANLQKFTCNNPNLDLVNANEYAKFGLIPSIHSQDIERKQNSDDNKGP